ncbi:hypothetical protein [Altericroceibacterium xinjiangense]|uniref:hypothetical protein n=1 Tax=Altericroceibacterium xinjiangense TaxID=762261 RepID=UPI0013DF5432|nr:hypothetical protein [Altericroceibacterium xinjiangense]
MFWSIMRQMAALTKSCQIALMVVAGIVVEVRGGEHHLRRRKHGFACKFGHAQLLGAAVR